MTRVACVTCVTCVTWPLQSLETLSVIEEVLQRSPTPRRDKADACWQKGLDYLRFDGLTNSDDRDTMVAHFNNPSLQMRLFLISTKVTPP